MLELPCRLHIIKDNQTHIVHYIINYPIDNGVVLEDKYLLVTNKYLLVTNKYLLDIYLNRNIFFDSNWTVPSLTSILFQNSFDSLNIHI